MLKIITNNIPRNLIESYELSPKERLEFDYIDWKAIDEGEDSATFFKYHGNLYDLGEFMRCDNNGELRAWDGYSSDSYFSGVLIKYINDCEQLIAAHYYS